MTAGAGWSAGSRPRRPGRHQHQRHGHRSRLRRFVVAGPFQHLRHDRVGEGGEEDVEGGLGHPGTDNVRITLGDSWALASCSATSVRVKTTPTKVGIEAATTPGCRPPPTDRPADRSANWSGCPGVPPQQSARPARPQPAPAATAGPRTDRAPTPGRAPAGIRPAPVRSARTGVGPVCASSAGGGGVDSPALVS
jgi:hypothetical protein